MNIYSPSAQPSPVDLKPILFFIHGGAFVIGAGSDYDGTQLAKKHDALVITINYRLGSFGWVQFVKGSANFGFKDQREAMHFIQRSTAGAKYISAFGGDPSRIMIFGESAGAISVVDHLVSPRSFGLFTEALFESGMPSAKAQNVAVEQGGNYSQAAGCSEDSDVLACMRGKKTAELTKAEGILNPASANPFTSMGWGPSVDVVDIPEDPLALIMAGKHAGVPVVGGSNTDEGDLFVYPSYPLGMTNDQYKQFVRDFISNGRPFNESHYEAILEMYPPNLLQNRKTASNLIADATFVCGAKIVVQHVEQSFLYHFNYGNGPVIHSAELAYVFENGRLNTAGEALAETMGKFWVSLAARGRPGTEEEWPAYRNETDNNIVLDRKITIESGRRLKYCNFWLHYFTEGLNIPDTMAALGRVATTGVSWPPAATHMDYLVHV